MRCGAVRHGSTGSRLTFEEVEEEVGVEEMEVGSRGSGSTETTSSFSLKSVSERLQGLLNGGELGGRGW